MFVHTVIMVIEPHMKQGRQHKLISSIFLATSVTKKLDHNIMSGLTNRVQILKEGYFEQLDKKELSETSHWYIFLKKC